MHFGVFASIGYRRDRSRVHLNSRSDENRQKLFQIVDVFGRRRPALDT
jgi:hypothetical protein